MQPNFANRTYTIGGNSEVSIVRNANFVTCLAATGAFKISLDGGPLEHFEAGIGFKSFEGFNSLRLVNESGSAIVVQLAMGKGDIQDNRVVISGEINTAQAMPDVFTSGSPIACPNGASTQIAAANPLRREIILTNEDASATVRIVPSGAATAGQGLPLGPSQSATLQSSAAVFIRNDSGGAVSVAWAELEATP